MKDWKEWGLMLVLVVGLTLLLMLLIILTSPSANPMSTPEPKSETELLEQADQLKRRLTTSATDYLKNAAAGFRLNRSLRVQEHLFREDLAWMSRGFSKGQVNLMVFVVVAFSLERVEGEIAVLEKKDPPQQVHIRHIGLYKQQALMLLDKLSGGLKDLSPSEFLFYF